MRFDIITIFPKIFDSYFGESIIKRAQAKQLVKIKTHNLRDWATDKHKSVDDTPYGGGAGMVMRVDVLWRAIAQVKSQKSKGKSKNQKSKVILLSAKGKTWTQAMARKYVKLDRVILICGRYEGVDERVKEFVDEEISVGDYVLTGGELAAAIVVDSVARLLPGVLGNKESARDESHSQTGVLEYPHYTKPEVFRAGRKKYSVPKVLLSGNHKEIEEWRRASQKSKVKRQK